MTFGTKVALSTVALGAGVFAWANWPAGRLDRGVRADRVVVEKAARRLHLVKDGRVLKTYRVALGGNPLGHKQQEGDQRTPEGEYLIDRRNPASSYHLALHVSYPSPEDTSRATRARVAPGGDIMIHGLRNGLGWMGRLHRLRDWTAGCVAVTDREIEEIWHAVPDGTPISLQP
jgi:murein L,D-transpeptidase YafK